MGTGVQGAAGGWGGYGATVTRQGDVAKRRDVQSKAPRTSQGQRKPPHWITIKDQPLEPYTLQGASASGKKMTAIMAAKEEKYEQTEVDLEAAQRAHFDAKTDLDWGAQSAAFARDEQTAAWHESAESWEQLDVELWCAVLAQLDDAARDPERTLYTSEVGLMAEDFERIEQVSRFFGAKDKHITNDFHGDPLGESRTVNLVELAAYQFIRSKSFEERLKVENDDYGKGLFWLLRNRLPPRFEYGKHASSFEISQRFGSTREICPCLGLR